MTFGCKEHTIILMRNISISLKYVRVILPNYIALPILELCEANGSSHDNRTLVGENYVIFRFTYFATL